MCEAYKEPIICCFHCQKYGQKSNICQSQRFCANYGRPVSLPNESSSNNQNCANCGGNYRSSLNVCPVFKTLSSVIAYSYRNKNPGT